MASFPGALWESIFTPGPTPALLRAANVAFAALQVVLLALLAATASVHFVVLSVLCAGLWCAINWFAAELVAAQGAPRLPPDRRERLHDAAVEESSDTEVEGAMARTAVPLAAAAAATTTTTTTTGELRHRTAQAAGADVYPEGTQSSASTEDEWEKVSESERDKGTSPR